MNKFLRQCLSVGSLLLVLFLVSSLLPESHLQAQEGGVPTIGERITLGPVPSNLDENLNATDSYLQVPGAAMRPENSADVEWAVPTVGNIGCIYAESGDPQGYWNIPIYPPQGATLTKLQVYVYDASETANSTAGFSILDQYGNIITGIAADSSGNSGNSFFEVTLPNYLVDYSTYSYILWWKPNEIGTNMKICAFRITYTPPGSAIFLPSILNGN